MSSLASKFAQVLVILSMATTTGCRTLLVKTRDLSTDNPQQLTTLPGVPFYVKTAFCLQTTTYIEPVYDVTLSLQTVRDSSGKEVAVGSPRASGRLLSEAGFRSDALRNLRVIAAGSAPHADELDVLRLWDMLDRYRVTGGFPADSTNYFMAGNQFSTDVANEYSRVYYYNVRSPVIGSSSAEVNLDASGSLTKAVGSTDDQTLPALLGALPAKEFLSASLIPARAAATVGSAFANDPRQHVRADAVRIGLQIVQSNYRHNLAVRSVMDQAHAIPCSPASPLTWQADHTRAAYSRELVGTTAPPASTTKSDTASASR